MDTLSSDSKVALCGDCDPSILSFLECRGVRGISWASNISALICGAEHAGRWKFTEAQRLGIRCIPAVLPFVESNLWTTKYAPQKITDVIGNTTQINDLITWLRDWGKEGAPRAALATGPPGIGKTTVAHMIVRGCGYEVVEFNASDERSATAVRRTFEEAARSGHVGKRRVIIMDEVDGMSSGDRGGIGELAKLVRTTTFPILCIANERGSPRLRPLTSVCLDIRFARPTKTLIAKTLMATVVAREKLNVTATELEKLCERNGNDIRSILNFLQFSFALSGGGGGGAAAAAGASGKDELQRVDAFSATGRLFGPGGTVADREALVFVDHGMVPLMVGEAYIAATARGRGDDDAKLERIVRAADSVGLGDIIDRRIHTGHNWALLPAAVQATVAAAAAAAGPAPFQIFPAWLGKNSKRLKHRRWFSDMARRRGSGREAFLDSTDLLRMRLFREGGDAAAICDRLTELRLTRDDMMESLTETVFTGCDESVAMETKLKGAISREWKKRVDSAVAVSTKASEEDAEVEYDSDSEEYDIST